MPATTSKVGVCQIIMLWITGLLLLNLGLHFLELLFSVRYLAVKCVQSVVRVHSFGTILSILIPV